ncbi:3-hydroxybutyrate dehydrogenase [Elioraea sp.]|uniref:3-hydroxybutyrate dehydrogenase n=1 Tax=Elioraea sp. TaxID=2185103 RepID=UPI003F6FDC79
MNIVDMQPGRMAAGDLSGKVAIVTGSTSGIGLGIARALASAGATLVINGLTKLDEAEAVRSELTMIGARPVFYSPADMSDAVSIEGMIEMTLESCGRIDILVNNAGIQHVAPIDAFPVEKWNRILAINLTSAFHTTRLALPHMRAMRWGRIINVASAHGLVGSAFKSAYVAAKHGIVGLTKVTALETAEDGITCNALCPGYVYTPLVEAQIDDQATAYDLPRERVVREVLLAKQPNKRFATVEEMGAIVRFLASDAAASITGIALPADGGWTAQ